MSSVTAGYNHSVASLAKRRSTKEHRARITQQISKFLQDDEASEDDSSDGSRDETDSLDTSEDSDSEDSDDSSADETLTGADFSRRVALSRGRLPDPQKLARLNKLYCAESMILTESHKMTVSDVLSDSHPESLEAIISQSMFTAEEKLVHLKGKHQRIQEKTDVLAKQRGYLAYSTADTAFESIPRSSLAVLNDFAEACDNPNEAEIAMLAQALRVPQVIIIFYFERRALRLKTFFVAKANLCNKGRIGTLIRKQQLLNEMGLADRR